MESSVAAVSDLLQRPALLLNASKTNIVVFGKAKKNPPPLMLFQLCGVEVVSAQSMKYLGIMLHHKLNFDHHFDYLCQKASATVPKVVAICQNTYGYSTKARKIMLDGCIGALFRYCASIFVHRIPNARRKIDPID